MTSSKGGRRDIALENDDYTTLNKLSVVINKENTHEDGSFTLCFWMYLLKSSKPGVVVRQGWLVEPIASPFLTLDADWRLTLHPLPPPFNDGTKHGIVPADESIVVVSDQSCPMEKWVHLGCEMGANIARLHMDGVVVGERSILFPSQNKCTGVDRGQLLLSGGDGSFDGGNVQAYGHYALVLPQPSVTNHYVKNPPLELSLDGSTTGAADDHELEEGGDGVWSVVGGKASCRRNFALDVVLLDALGRSVHKEMELVASLVYADTGSPVEKPKDDAEAPLLTTFDGVEFPSVERPIKLVHGRASFKLKISQLSSKCDNRLFRVCFDSPAAANYPFLRAFSRPIRCVSRNRNSRTPAAPWKRSVAALSPLDGATSPAQEEAAPENTQLNGDVQANGHVNATSMKGSKLILTQGPAKMARLGEDRGPSRHVSSSSCLEKSPERLGLTSDLSKGDALVAMVSGLQWGMQPAVTNYPWSVFQQGFPIDPRHVGVTENSFLGFNKQYPFGGGTHFHAGTEEKVKKCVPASSRLRATDATFSDLVLFRYCLESMDSRASFLRGVTQSRSDQDLLEFAALVSQYTGCHHNGYQISIARKLLEEGSAVWSQVSADRYLVRWSLLVSVVEEHFRRLSGSKRCFTVKDKEFLKRIARCGEETSREEFDLLWQWLYPVALTLTLSQVHDTWESEDPKWIEGMISREEGEEMLRSTEVLPSPGTFLVRFASSRVWPHPDAGALVVSYVGQDLKINHKLLSLDQNSGHGRHIMEDKNSSKPLSELLLLQPELSHLCSSKSSSNCVSNS